jgi:GNAT superfamily N-acetyltransferase
VKQQVEIIRPEDTYDLRHRVLRPHQPIADCHYPGDFTGTTFHLGVRNSGTLVSIGSFYLEKHLDFNQDTQIRLRGMATDPLLNGKGFGRLLMVEADKICAQRSAPFIWCYAREKAFDFYTRVGFKFHGPFFELPGIGRHKVMFKHL